MSNEFVERRHAAYATPAQLLAELVEKVTSQTMTTCQQVVHGYDNEVYVIETTQDDAFVIRIQQHGGTGYAEEEWAIRQCRNAGTPVADVCYVDTLKIKDELKPVMIQRKLSGQALDAVRPNLSQPELTHVLAQAGSALGKIHSVAVDGFYKLRPNGQWDFPDWVSIDQNNRRERLAEIRPLSQVGFTEDEINVLVATFSQQPQQGTSPQPVLCHGDFGLDHIFVDDQLNLTGVIDFGDFQGGKPVLDFVIFSIYHPDIELAWLQDGYGNKALFDKSFERELTLDKVSYLVGYLTHCIAIEDVAEQQRTAKLLRESIQYLWG